MYITAEWKASIIQELRKRRLKMRDLAELTKKTPGAISRILSPDSQITTRNETAIAIGEHLGFPLGPKMSDEAVTMATDLLRIKETHPEDYEALRTYMRILKLKKK